MNIVLLMSHVLARIQGFKWDDSIINLLLVKTHNIYKSLDSDKEVCTIFHDVSKACDKIWHGGLLFKLGQFGIADSLISLLEHYLTDQSQGVVLNSKASPSQHISAGVPHGLISVPLLFLNYVNKVKYNFLGSIKLFADDTALIKEIDNLLNDLKNDTETQNPWVKQWLIPVKTEKTKYLIFFKKNLTNEPILPLS
jgi:hypothetical protein